MKPNVTLTPDEQDALYDRLASLPEPTVVDQLAMQALDRMLQNRLRAQKFKRKYYGRQ